MDYYVLTVLLLDAAATGAWFLFFVVMDPRRRSKRSIHILFRFLLLGGVGSVFVALALSELAYGALGGFVFGAPAPIDGFFDQFFFVGPVEELAKFSMFLALASRGRVMAETRQRKGGGMHKPYRRPAGPAFLEPRDALLQAACVALGFAAIENYGYAMVYGPSILWLRSLLAVSGHIAYSALWGAASANLVFAPPTVPSDQRWKVVLAAVFLSGMVHGLYNYLLEMYAFWAAVGLNAATFCAAAAVFRHFAHFDPFRRYRFSESHRAVEAIRIALRVQPEHYALNRRIALHYMHLCRYPPAAGHLNRCLRQKPRDRYLRFYRAVALALAQDRPTERRRDAEELATSLEAFRLSELPALRGFVERLLNDVDGRKTVLAAMDQREAPREPRIHELNRRRWLAAPPRTRAAAAGS